MTPKFDLLVEKTNPSKDKKDIIDRMDPVDKLQLALDVIGIEPSVGTIADAANIVFDNITHSFDMITLLAQNNYCFVKTDQNKKTWYDLYSKKPTLAIC